MSNDLEYYRGLNYAMLIQYLPDDELYSASIPDLPGLTVYEDTVEQALTSLNDAKDEWLATAKKRGIDIPEPDTAFDRCSVDLQMSKSLHEKVIAKATHNNVSPN